MEEVTGDAPDSLLRNTSLSRRVRTLVRFHFLMAAVLCFLVVAHFGRCFNITANMRRCLFYRKSCFRHNFKATANRSVKIQGGMIRFCPEYSIKSTLKLAVSPNSPLVIHPIIYLTDNLLAKPTCIHKLFFLHRYRLVRYADISLYL